MTAMRMCLIDLLQWGEGVINQETQLLPFEIYHPSSHWLSISFFLGIFCNKTCVHLIPFFGSLFPREPELTQ